MDSATTDKHPNMTALVAGVVVGFASRGTAVLAGTTPAAPIRH